MYYCGIDLGATKIYSVIIDRGGKIIARSKVKTKYTGNMDKITERISSCYDELFTENSITKDNITAIGIGVPSSVNIKKGIMIHAPNLELKNINITDILRKKFNKPVYADNDGNLGLYGEHSYGHAKNYKNIYGIFLGTGIGGAYIENGHIVRGKNYTAGEIGHMVIKMDGPKCGCGRKGCLEAIAGKLGIINYIKKIIDKKNKKTLLDEIEPDWRKNVGSSILCECYHRNDPAVKNAIKRAGKALGIACANIVNIIGIDAIVLGGGLFNEMSRDLLPIIDNYMHKYSIGNGADEVKLLISELEDSAVAYGAAKFVSEDKNKNFLIQ